MRVMITFEPGQTITQKKNVISSLGGTVVYSPSGNIKSLKDLWTIDIPDVQINAVKANALIENVTLDSGMRIDEFSLDFVYAKDYANNWGVNRVHAPAVHASGNTGAGIKFGVCDTGAVQHSDLIQYKTYNIINPGDDAPEEHGHAHHVSGIVCAQKNDVGVVGIAPGVLLHTIRVLSNAGSGSWSSMLPMAEKVIEWGLEIINCSFGGSSYPGAEVEAAFQAMADAGVTIFCSAGNSSGGVLGYPALLSSCIAVSSIDEGDGRSSFGAIGEKVECCGPGGVIYSCWAGGGYRNASGTSMSSPAAAAVGALARSNGTQDIRGLIPNAVVDLGDTGRDTSFGFGLFMADLAVGAPENPVFRRDVIFNLSKSFDPDGTIVEWYVKPEGTWVTLNNPIHPYSYIADGIFIVEATAKDNEGLITKPYLKQTIEIKTDTSGENKPPVIIMEISNQ